MAGWVILIALSFLAGCRAGSGPVLGGSRWGGSETQPPAGPPATPVDSLQAKEEPLPERTVPGADEEGPAEDRPEADRAGEEEPEGLDQDAVSLPSARDSLAETGARPVAPEPEISDSLRDGALQGMETELPDSLRDGALQGMETDLPDSLQILGPAPPEEESAEEPASPEPVELTDLWDEEAWAAAPVILKVDPELVRAFSWPGQTTDSLTTVRLNATPPDTSAFPFAIPSGGVYSRAPTLFPTEDALLYRKVMRRRAWPVVERLELFKPEWRQRYEFLAAQMDSVDERIATVEESLLVRLPDPRWTYFQGRPPTTLQTAGNVETGAVEISRVVRESPAAPVVVLDQDTFLDRLTSDRFWQVWAAEMARGLKATSVTGSRRGLVKLDLPIELPSQLRSVFGEGKPNLSVRGSERITFSGTSRWRPNEKNNEIARRQSKFPQLDMKQELNLQLTGTIGDKVSVDVDQSSQAASPLSNRIKIRYKGYEDEVVQRVDLGNTSLTLPGTNYVTYGGKAEGLFGINAQAKLGPIDFTGILTKQEGKSDSKSVSRSAETRTIEVDDLNYVANKYFFLRDPNGCPWELDQGTLDVFLDDYFGGNDLEQGAVPAVAWPPEEAFSDSIAYRGSFYRLIPGPPPDGDYQVQKNLYTGHSILILNRPLSDEYSLAVAYSGWGLNQNLQPDLNAPISEGGGLRPPAEPGGPDTLELALIRPTRSDPRLLESDLTTGPWAPLRYFELRNVYDLGARGILKDGFSLRIRAKTTFGQTQEPDRIGETTFLMMTGLDLSEETDTGNIPGRDDRVDNEWISYESGLIHFPDLRPFDPDSADLGYDLADCDGYRYGRFGPARPPGPGEDPEYDSQRLRRPRALPTDPDSTQYRAPLVYDRIGHTNPQADSRFYLEVTFRSPVTKIQLNAFGILAGSETVTASGRTLVRDRDYRIDYDFGEVEILEAANVTESDDISVTYSYMGFGGSQKTLGGIAAFYRPDDAPLAFSTSWLYESKGGVPGLEGERPRLGQEPSRTIVGEFAGSYKTESMLLTRLTDAVPGVTARVPSRLDMNFGVGFSLPNPNTKDKLYIDDFDGAKDVQSLSMSRRLWKPTALPLPDAETNNLSSDPDERAARRGELWWYSPRNAVREGDLQPNLEDREKDDSRQVLRMQFFPRGPSAIEKQDSWGGVVQVLSTRGLDLSRAQFLDIWVNDFRQYRPNPAPDQERRGYLYIDLGSFSEDAMWFREDPDNPLPDSVWFAQAKPNGKLDTEDIINPDDRLDQGSSGNEDTGLDNVPSGQAGDHYFDDYGYDESLSDSDPRKYARVNGQEGNQELDTEDLNGNDVLEKLSSYFQIRIPLADSTLWETDVYRDYVHNDPNAPPDLVSVDNGWRRIRIPLGSDSLVKKLWDGNANEPVWEKIFHARVWITGFDDRQTLEIGGLEVIGNRWYENAISDLRGRPLEGDDLASGEEFYVGVVNNKDDALVYIPPIEVREQDNIPEKEQSITLNVREFQPGHQVSIYRTYAQNQDFTLYENMEFYLKGRFETGQRDLNCSIRLCRDASTDTLNYYEYKVPVRDFWELVEIDFAALSQLQLEEPDPSTGLIVRDLGNGVVMTKKGSPSLTSIKRIAFQVSNVDSRPLGRGSIWIDELRLTQVKKDTGVASRLSISADLSDLARLDFNISRTGADFLKIGQDRGSGITSTAWNFSGSTNLIRFAGPLGIDAPFRTSINSARSVPKFRTNSDLVLDEASDRDITETRSEDYSLSLSRKTGRNWVDRYLLNPWSVSGGYRRNTNLNPSSRDTTVTRRGSVGWNLNLATWGDWDANSHWLLSPFGALLGERTKVRLTPTGLSANLNGNRTTQKKYSRTDLNQPYGKQPGQDRTASTLSLSASARPLSPLTYKLDSSRDMMLRENQQTLLGANLGRETSRKHQLSLSYDIPLLKQALSPRFSWNGNSDLTFARQAANLGEDEPDRVNDLRNNRTTNYQARISLPKLLESLQSLARLGGEEDSAKAANRSGGGGGLGSRGFTIGDINSTYSISSGSNYTLRKGEPSLFYQLGLDDDPGVGVRSLNQSAETKTSNQTLNLDTRLTLPTRVQVTTRFSTTEGRSNSNGLVSTNQTLKWPEFDLNWGSLHEKLGLKRWFRTFQATTRYSRESSEQGSSSRPKDSETVRVSMNPILNINAGLHSGIQATLNSSTSSTETTRFGTGASTTRQSDMQLGVTLKKTLNLTRQVTVPLTGRTQTIQTKLDVTTSLDYKTRRQEVITGSLSTVSHDTAGWKFATGATYQFTQNINGTGSVNFGQDTDNKNQAQTTRFIGISVSAQFTF